MPNCSTRRMCAKPTPIELFWLIEQLLASLRAKSLNNPAGMTTFRFISIGAWEGAMLKPRARQEMQCSTTATLPGGPDCDTVLDTRQCRGRSLLPLPKRGEGEPARTRSEWCTNAFK